MYEKYRTASFGRCPHVFCQGQPVLPVGLSDLPRNYTVNVFCPRCHGLFFPKSTRQANIDGAYFGTTFPHLYLMTHPVRALLFALTTVTVQYSQSNLLTLRFLPPFTRSQDMVPAKPTQNYVPRAYGFKIHPSSLYYRNHEEGPPSPQIETSQRGQRKSKRLARK
jgi:casein kinase II subunit beta